MVAPRRVESIIGIESGAGWIWVLLYNFSVCATGLSQELLHNVTGGGVVNKILNILRYSIRVCVRPLIRMNLMLGPSNNWVS